MHYKYMVLKIFDIYIISYVTSYVKKNYNLLYYTCFERLTSIDVGLYAKLFYRFTSTITSSVSLVTLLIKLCISNANNSLHMRPEDVVVVSLLL
jgi:hypothetical protein